MVPPAYCESALRSGAERCDHRGRTVADRAARRPDADIVATKARSFVSNDDMSSSAGLAQTKARDPNYIQNQLDRALKGAPAMGSTMWFI